MLKKKFEKILATALCAILMIVAIPMISARANDTDASTGTQNSNEAAYIDNSDVTPLYVPDTEVTLEDAGDGQPDSPDWLKTAIMVEVRLDTASTDGTLAGCTSMLDHYQEMGVNVLWVTPIHEMGEYLPDPNGYNNLGVHSIDPALTGVSGGDGETFDDYEAGWEKFAEFVEAAHDRNIRILLDIVPWGVAPTSPLLDTNPSLFVAGDQTDIPDDVASGQRYSYQWNAWGGYSYNWASETFKTWFSDNILKIIDVTGIDGIRADLEPNVDLANYSFWDDIRAEALEQGHKIVVMSEQQNTRDDDYDLEQFGVMGYDSWTDPNGNSSWTDGGTTFNTWNYALQFHKEFVRDFFLEKSIVDCVKNGTYIGIKAEQQTNTSGQYRFYTYNFSNHDHGFTRIEKDLIRVGYQGIFAPFIPLWYMGEEMGADVHNEPLYYAEDAFDVSLLEDSENRDFYETLKKYIRIRRTYPDIFENFETNARNNKICNVTVSDLEKYPAYARYDGNGNGVIIVPNANETNPNATMTVTVPFAEMGMDTNQIFTVTDLMNDTEIISGNTAMTGTFDVQIPTGEIGVYLVSYACEDEIVYTDEVEDAVTLYNKHEAPTKKGYVFGGWFADETGETQITSTTVEAETTLYAKFVPAHVLSVKAQNHEDVATSGTIRLISAVDNEQHYDKVGFDVYFGNKDEEGYKKTVESQTVYNKIVVDKSESEQDIYLAEDVFGTPAQYFSIAEVTGIAEESFESTIYVKPYWVTKDGTKVYGLGKYASVQDGIDGIISIPINIYTAQKIAAGIVEVTYPDNLIYKDYTASSRLFGDMTVKVNSDNHTIKCAGNIANVANGDIVADTDLYISLQFQVADGETVTVGQDRLYFAVADATQFCDLNEELFDLSSYVWHIQY